MSVLQSNWDRYYNEYWEKCHAIYKQRGNQYNRDTEIRSYWIYGISSIFHCIWGKVNRLKSLVYGQHGPISGEDLGAYEDSLIDLGVYAAFAYAENRCRLSEFEAPILRERMAEHAETPSNLAIDHIETAPHNVERVVLEPGPQLLDHQFSSLHVGACPTCTDHAERTRNNPGSSDVSVGSGEHTEELPGADSENEEGGIFL